MQTDIWMAYSDSMHFSDKLSYKILFILSYGLQDTNLARFKHLQQFQKIEEAFSHRSGHGPRERRTRPPGPDQTATLEIAVLAPGITDGKCPHVRRLKREKDMISCNVRDSNTRPAG
jgi:hypothetical protein